MAFSMDSLPTRRAFAARSDAALDAAVTGLALCQRWEPKEPEHKAELQAAFKQLRLWALRADKIINGDLLK